LAWKGDKNMSEKFDNYYPQCSKCGSHDIGTRKIWRHGFFTFVWILQLIFPAWFHGAGSPWINEMHDGGYCRVCNSERIWKYESDRYGPSPQAEFWMKALIWAAIIIGLWFLLVIRRW
jgi:hypothetical protein